MVLVALPKIQLRGANSVTGLNQPLIVVDGVPMDNFTGASNNDIDNPTLDMGNGKERIMLISACPNWDLQRGGWDTAYSDDDGETWTEYKNHWPSFDGAEKKTYNRSNGKSCAVKR